MKVPEEFHPQSKETIPAGAALWIVSSASNWWARVERPSVSIPFHSNLHQDTSTPRESYCCCHFPLCSSISGRAHTKDTQNNYHWRRTIAVCHEFPERKITISSRASRWHDERVPLVKWQWVKFDSRVSPWITSQMCNYCILPMLPPPSPPPNRQ